MTGPEDCSDGMDNDGDGQIDCLDSDCPGSTCVDAVPQDWEGYYAVHVGAAADPPFGCGAVVQPESYDKDPAGQHQCEACTCQADNNSVCHSATTIACNWGSTNCMGGTQVSVSAPDGVCAPLSNPTNSTQISCLQNEPPINPTVGTCTSSTTKIVGDTSLFGSRVDACPPGPGGIAVTGACGAGKVCVANPPQDASVCIKKIGANACPAGFTNEIQAFNGATDTRSCTDCGCGVNVQCDPTPWIEGYDTNACVPNQDAPIHNVGGGCVDLSPLMFGMKNHPLSVRYLAINKTETCSTNGGEPMGSVTPENPVTFCCTQ